MDLERNIPAEAKRKTNGTGHHYMRNLTYDTMDLAMEQNHARAEQAGAAKGEGVCGADELGVEEFRVRGAWKLS